MCEWVEKIIDGCTEYKLDDRWAIEKVLEEIKKI
jgi:hypothetical protein